MKVLFIGLGSIALKHLKALWEINPNAQVYALRSNHNSNSTDGVTDIFAFSEIPEGLDFIMITNPTSLHNDTIKAVLPLGIPLFIEKPVVSDLITGEDLLSKVESSGIITYVACNLRFHPAILFLKKEFSRRQPLEMTSYAGSFLPEWRPGQDYRDVYSSKTEMGGGVHLDLIHELDYCFFLLGEPQNVHASYRRTKSKLEITSSDVAHYVVEYPNTSVFITLNYYRKQVKRTIDIVWEDDVWTVDLIKNNITNIHNELIFSEKLNAMDTYVNQLNYFINCLDSNMKPMNNFAEGFSILKSALHEQ